jgi:hypothetical protein
VKPSTRIFAAGLILVLVLVAGAMWAYAQNDFDIHACYNPRGVLRIVDDVSNCRDQETELQWNIDGPQGPPGVLGFYTVASSVITAPGGTHTTACIDCSAGDQVVGGGFELGREATLDGSWPGDEDTWCVSVDPSGADMSLLVYARCADMTP